MVYSNFKIRRSIALLSILLFVGFQSLVAQTLLERIKALPDIVSVEKMDQNPFFSEAFVVNVKQPIDHQHPEKGSFPQRVFVSHLGYDRPECLLPKVMGVVMPPENDTWRSCARC